MPLNIGIIGLPNVGKTAIFNALTNVQHAEAVNYLFSTVEPNTATVPVPDSRLDQLAALVKPKKVINTTVDFTDIAGLVRGASKGEGLGNQFLANIRESTAILQVVRCFEDDNIIHVENSIDPIRDIETIETELLLADLESVTRRQDKAKKLAKFDKDQARLLEELDRLNAWLDLGNPAAGFDWDLQSATLTRAWLEMSLLTAKKIIYCANVDENSLSEDNEYVLAVRKLAQERGARSLKICARIEEELCGLDPQDQQDILKSYNVEQSGLISVIRTGYDVLGLCSYFTAGPKEVRAWTFKRGWKAPQCAGVIHSDFEKGFIRAEVIKFDDYIAHKTEAACRSAGCLRVEGKQYVVQDCDVMHFLFNV